ncbi:MAG: hypothetical protein KDJ73_05090 [Notoacmeibacter sp.]|nr:hypothetical protein [Notoacmeibacter sp.]MCC0032732.1 hypothetical protein [Brucellaceae bacterium]
MYQNVQGFNLPGVQLPQGADEVRAADGTTCRSAVSGNGAYLDLGVIGTPKTITTSSRTSTEQSFSAYGRVVIPLGRSAKRLDCTQLYALEVERLKIELRLMQMGLGNQGRPADVTETASISAEPEDTGEEAQPGGQIKGSKSKASESKDWADEGWTTKGKN